jgi:hypothetical protein
MPWVRISDDLYRSEKVDELGRAAGWIWTLCLSYAGDRLTNGVIPVSFARRYLNRAGDRKLIQELVSKGWLHEASDLCEECRRRLLNEGTALPEAGWYVHGYLAHQDSRRIVERRRAKDRGRKAEDRAAKRQEVLREHPFDEFTPRRRGRDFDDLPPGSRTGNRSSTRPREAGDPADGAENESVSGVESTPTDSRCGGGGSTSTSGSSTPLHARAGDRRNGYDPATVDAALEAFRCSGIVVNEIDDRIGVENAMAAHPDKDVVLAAREVVAWWLGKNASVRERLNVHSALLTFMSKQQQPAAPSEGRRPDPERAAMYDAITRGDPK